MPVPRRGCCRGSPVLAYLEAEYAAVRGRVLLIVAGPGCLVVEKRRVNVENVVRIELHAGAVQPAEARWEVVTHLRIDGAPGGDTAPRDTRRILVSVREVVCKLHAQASQLPERGSAH